MKKLQLLGVKMIKVKEGKYDETSCRIELSFAKDTHFINFGNNEQEHRVRSQ